MARTPGDWTFEVREETRGVSAYILAGNTPIARVFIRKALNPNEFLPYRENGNLLAVAPEMLRELEETARWLEICLKVPSSGKQLEERWPGPHNRLAALHAVIIKAKGSA
jgi:hypothetical protein